jgi:hypothetical protein
MMMNMSESPVEEVAMTSDAVRAARLRKRTMLVVLAAGNLVMWLVPDNVAELVARDHEVWFGRYSGSRLIIRLAIAAGSAAFAFFISGRDEPRRRRRAYRVTVGFITVAVSVLATDLGLRLNFDWPYVLGPMAYHRPPERRLSGVFTDKPLAALSYPVLAPGYGDVPWTLTTDSRGFRNAGKIDKADFVALGDSFTEGSVVSDEEVWTSRFATKSGKIIYNLGMHGYAPQHYLAALHDHGLRLRPQTVVVMFYEGNDFRSARLDAKPIPRWAVYVGSEYSPLFRAVSEHSHRAFGHWGAGFAAKRLDALSWLPIGFPVGPNERFYAFPPSFLVEHLVTEEDFRRKSRWRRSKEVLTEIKRVCDQAEIRLVLAYIPTKAHVVLPLVADRLPAEKVLAFTRLQSDDMELPDETSFLPELLDRLSVKERTLSEWCIQSGIEFVSLTGPLREATSRGEQAYYTYDDHWTPIGHKVAASVLVQFMEPGRTTDR